MGGSRKCLRGHLSKHNPAYSYSYSLTYRSNHEKDAPQWGTPAISRGGRLSKRETAYSIFAHACGAGSISTVCGYHRLFAGAVTQMCTVTNLCVCHRSHFWLLPSLSLPHLTPLFCQFCRRCMCVSSTFCRCRDVYMCTVTTLCVCHDSLILSILYMGSYMWVWVGYD